MPVEVLFFGSLTDATSATSVPVDEVKDTDALVKELVRKYPELATAKYFIAVNKQMISQNTILQQGDTVALMPPFSGG